MPSLWCRSRLVSILLSGHGRLSFSVLVIGAHTVPERTSVGSILEWNGTKLSRSLDDVSTLWGPLHDFVCMCVCVQGIRVAVAVVPSLWRLIIPGGRTETVRPPHPSIDPHPTRTSLRRSTRTEHTHYGSRSTSYSQQQRRIYLSNTREYYKVALQIVWILKLKKYYYYFIDSLLRAFTDNLSWRELDGLFCKTHLVNSMCFTE